MERYSIFNEPNNWTWPSGTTDPVANWQRRLQLASDAIQAALSDVNTRYGRSLSPQILAPNTANGATKYNDTVSGDTWGQRAVLGLRQRWDGSTDANWSNFHVYNYQKYSTSSADYVSDFQALRARLDADGASWMPLALTEFNVRTGANYDARTETLDSPSDHTALAANSIALSAVGAKQLYLFKFAQTLRSGGTYPVAKNGTHYVQNETSTLNNIGGATKAAEVYRLFAKASGSSRQRLAFSGDTGSALTLQVSRDAATGEIWLFLTNTGTTSLSLDLDLSALGLAEGSLAVVEEVSSAFSGGVSRVLSLQAGHLQAAAMPGQATWLVSLTAARGFSSSLASEDAQLGDGATRSQSGGAASSLMVRSDGSVDGRRVTLLKFNVQQQPADLERVLLDLSASTLTSSGAIQAHVYGLQSDAWSETSSWASLPSVLRQNVAAGNRIANNVVADQGGNASILGQLVVTGSTASHYQLDVSDFVRSQTDGWASFLIVQDHRWDVSLPSLASGDTQVDGLRISSREAGASLAPQLQWLTRSSTPPPPPEARSLIFSLANAQSLGGLSVADEDLVGFDGTSFRFVLDGSAVGLAGLRLDASARLTPTDWLLSFDEAGKIGSLSFDDSDVLRLSQRSDGGSSVSLWFDASDLGLSTSGEDLDAMALIANSSSAGGYDLVFSTLADYSAAGLNGGCDDLIRFRPTSLGSSSAGSLSRFLDGSAFGLSNTVSENIDGLAIADGRLYLSTDGSFSVPRADGSSLAGASEDVIAFLPTAWNGLQITAGTFDPALVFDGSSFGLQANDLKSLELPL